MTLKKQGGYVAGDLLTCLPYFFGGYIYDDEKNACPDGRQAKL